MIDRLIEMIIGQFIDIEEIVSCSPITDNTNFFFLPEMLSCKCKMWGITRQGGTSKRYCRVAVVFFIFYTY